MSKMSIRGGYWPISIIGSIQKYPQKIFLIGIGGLFLKSSGICCVNGYVRSGLLIVC